MKMSDQQHYVQTDTVPMSSTQHTKEKTLRVTAAASETPKPVALSARQQHQKNPKKVSAERADSAARKAKPEKNLAELREVKASIRPQSPR